MPPFSAVRAVLEGAIRDRIAPAAVVEVGRASGVVWRHALGSLTCDPGAAPAPLETIFDLASLTKVISTTTLAMRLVEAGRLRLDANLAGLLPRWQGNDRAAVTVADLLEHASGLPATLPLYLTCSGRDEFEHAICGTPLEFSPRSRSVYSDLGFILLGFVLEDAAGAPLDEQFDVLARALWPPGEEEVRYHRLHGDDLGRAWQSPGLVAPTQFDRWRGRLLCGEVDDRNAAALAGVAGHSGLFGTARAVGRFAGALLRGRMGLEGKDTVASPRTIARFLERTSVPGSSRALGWDTMLPTSSCGTRMSAEAFGHTGFTGTSLWIDPVADVYVVLLTNRVHPEAGSADAITAMRRAVHDAVIGELR